MQPHTLQARLRLCVSPAQHLLRVAYQDPGSGCTSKTLAVPPGASIAALNQLCAAKFRVAQPDAFGLFLYQERDYRRLPPRAPAHRLPTAGYLVYRRWAERPDTLAASLGGAAEAGSGEPEAGGGEEEGGREMGASPAKPDPVTTAGQEESQAGGGPAPPGAPEAEGGPAAVE